jgi:hypothetical protein
MYFTCPLHDYYDSFLSYHEHETTLLPNNSAEHEYGKHPCVQDITAAGVETVLSDTYSLSANDKYGESCFLDYLPSHPRVLPLH